MNDKICEVVEGGFVSKKKCGEPTLFRCPNCGKAVCQRHGQRFVIEKWQYRITGLTCSDNCTKGLIANIGTLQQEFIQANPTDLEGWGGIERVSLRGQDIDPIQINRAEVDYRVIDKYRSFISKAGLQSFHAYRDNR